MKKTVILLVMTVLLFSIALPNVSKANRDQSIQAIERQIQKLSQEKKEAEKKANEAMNRINMIEAEKNRRNKISM